MAIPDIPPGGVHVPVVDGEIKLTIMPDGLGIFEFECLTAGEVLRIGVRPDDAAKLIHLAALALDRQLPTPGVEIRMKSLPVKSFAVVSTPGGGVLVSFQLQIGDGVLTFPIDRTAVETMIASLQAAIGIAPFPMPTGRKN